MLTLPIDKIWIGGKKVFHVGLHHTISNYIFQSMLHYIVNPLVPVDVNLFADHHCISILFTERYGLFI